MRILSVNVGIIREIIVKQQPVKTGLYKMPVSGAVPVHRSGLQNDAYVEPRPMGTEHHAVYAYPYEHYAYWQRELGHEAYPMGQFGENLTVTGLLEHEVRIGDIFRFGSAVLQVAQPRLPCAKLNERMGMRFAPIFLASARVGYYLRVLEEGHVEQGDSIELLSRDENSPTMEEFVRVAHYEYWDAQALQHLLQARDLMPAWREIIESKLARSLAAKGWHGLREFVLVKKETESEDTVSLYFQCARGRELPSYHGGQKITVVLGGYTAQQQRRAYALSGNPLDRSSYRITVRRMPPPDATLPAGAISSHLVAMNIGERILCTAPHGALMHYQKQACNERAPVLVSQGIGIAPMLSLLYELEACKAQTACLCHEATPSDPQGLLREVHALIARNPGFRMIEGATAQPGQLATELTNHQVSPTEVDIHIAGPRNFVERISTELEAAGLDSSVMLLQSFG